MFTIEEIKAAHSKVKSGADFPAYVQDLISLGVTHYETFVSDGHTDYFGTEDYNKSAPSKYETLAVAAESNIPQFQQDLKDHQQGKTDYSTFCNDCATSGVEKWVVDMDKMTCIYYDKQGNEMLAEAIPVV